MPGRRCKNPSDRERVHLNCAIGVLHVLPGPTPIGERVLDRRWHAGLGLKRERRTGGNVHLLAFRLAS